MRNGPDPLPAGPQPRLQLPTILALELGVVAFLIVLNGFFAMAELAVVSFPRPRLATMAEAGSAGAPARGPP